MRTVVGRVHEEGVVGDAEIVQRLEDLSDILVMVDHGVVIRALPSPRLADAFRLGMGAEMHVGRIHPQEERLVGALLPLHEVYGSGGDVVVGCFHPLFGQRAGVLADLLADLAEARIDRLVVGGRGLAVHHAARSELGAERSILRVVRQFRLFLGVQVVEVA